MSSQIIMAAAIQYNLSFPEAKGHYVDVEMTIPASNAKEVVLKLPVWAPGSYLVREFSRHIDRVYVNVNGKDVLVNKRDKNTWTFENDGKSASVVKYRVYAFELTVRTSFVDDSHAYLNGTNIFMYVEGRLNEQHKVTVALPSAWKTISCALPQEGKGNTFVAADYDLLADSPFEIGNHTLINFTAQGIPHTVAMVGQANYDVEKIKTDFTKIINEATSVFGTHPCKNYLFIVHNVNAGGGGLEHLNSTTVQVNRFAYSNENSYRGFLGLIAHEYFHLWNVKRLRPAPLGPFNYDQENYTSMLWISEGFTAFYDNWIVRRAGLMSADKYLEIISNEYSALSNLNGAKVQALSEASFDAWIKYYRRNENSNNTQVSYYDKGSIVASLLNAMIISHSNAAQNLDDLMKYLYNEYYQKSDRGFTEKEFQTAAEKFCGQNLDAFFAKYVNGVDAIPYDEVMGKIGFKISDLNAGKAEISLGLTTSTTNGKILVSAVVEQSAAYKAGINVNDELIAIDNYRIDDLGKFISNRKVDEVVSVLYVRDGIVRNTNMTLEKSKNVKYKIEKSTLAEQETLRKKWLY